MASTGSTQNIALNFIENRKDLIMSNNDKKSFTDLGTDGVVQGIAAACVQAMREAADNATADRFIRLAAHQVSGTGEPTAERVTSHLHTTLKALLSTSAELRWAEHAGKI